MFQRVRALASEFNFFEFRLDTLDDPAAGVAALAELLREHPSTTAIATCRRKQNGGHFTGSATDELTLLQGAASAGARIVDLSLETGEELAANDSEALNELREGPAALLVSWHDFQGTPDLECVYTRMQQTRPDLFKIVPTARTLRDSFALLALLRNHGRSGDLVAMSMGMPGVPTRVLGPRYGSVFTFGSSEEGGETAPGQMTSRTLRDLYRIEMISAATQVYGVFGKPIGGSKSPVMLNTAFRENDIDAVYLPLESDDAAELFACVQQLALAGASVTMPLKEQIVPQLTAMSKLATELGAANTLLKTAAGLVGENTDVVGIVQPLEKRLNLQGASVLVLGAGGAARAAAFALQSRGVRVSICNRTHARAQALARETGGTAVERKELAGMRFDVILNGTPYGMANQQIESPIADDEMKCRFFFDMVYNPVETPLVRAAREHGIEVIPGYEMFVAQGAAQFELWTDAKAPIQSMQDAVLQSLGA